jgi:hypothetical protein
MLVILALTVLVPWGVYPQDSVQVDAQMEMEYVVISRGRVCVGLVGLVLIVP